MGLEQYHQKRDFTKTPEPKGKVHRKNYFRFVIQQHAASNLHYDFRIELEGVLKSWAIPKGPCLDPEVKRLAVPTEDHPVEYVTFEGAIPKKEYGGGLMIVWDLGEWEALDKNPLKAYHQGHLRFILHAKKLGGRWDLFRLHRENIWFLKKYGDDWAKPLDSFNVIQENPYSILSGKTVEEIADTYPELLSKTKKNTRKTPLSTIKKLKLPKTPFPEYFSPQLATLTDKPPKGDDWVHEVKFDGYRMLAFKQGNKVKIVSRNGKDWTISFKSIAEEVKSLPIKNAIIDGEIVILEKDRSNFQVLQNSLDEHKDAPFIYYVFDLVYYDSWTITDLPLLERKSLLKPLVTAETSSIRYSDHIEGQGDDIFTRACNFSLEGIISKRSDSSYINKRSKSWLKVKCIKRQEFVIGGYTPPKGSRSHFGSLYLGYYNDQDELVYAGNVGTGFNTISLKTIYSELKKRVIKENPFSTHPPGYKSAVWVKPELVGEVEFSEWTSENILRHPSFKGLRLDKKAKQVIKEEETLINAIPENSTSNTGGEKKPLVKLTHPKKILFPEDKITKQGLFDYYSEVGSLMLPYVKERPLTLVRCPDHYKECFYQKHKNASSSKAVLGVPIKSKNNAIEDYLYIDDIEGILGLVQMGVLEIHLWGSTIHHLEQPNQIVFDLDPAPEVTWKQVVRGAFEVKHYLEELELTSFVKTTGGKGLHVVVPIIPTDEWEEIKEFTRFFVETIVKIHPTMYLSTMSKLKRKGKIFLDYLRNQRDATAIAPFSTRARLHAPVATPIHWDELTDNIEDTYYTLKTLPRRLKHLRQDPWEDFWKVGKSQALNLDSFDN